MKKEKSFIVSVYDDSDNLLKAIEKIRASGIKIHDVFTPYPVHGLEDALGYKRSWMPKAAFLFGTLGCILALWMQISMMGWDWPMIIGGKPFTSIPDFIPVTFETTVLLAAFGMAFTFFGIQGLHPFKTPKIFDRRSTDDKHIVAILNNSSKEEKIESLLQDTDPIQVYKKDFTEEETMSFLKYLTRLFTYGVTSSSRELKN